MTLGSKEATTKDGIGLADVIYMNSLRSAVQSQLSDGQSAVVGEIEWIEEVGLRGEIITHDENGKVTSLVTVTVVPSG